MIDRTEQHLLKLNPELQNPAHSLIYFARTSGIPLIITSSTRTKKEQKKLYDMGLSKTLKSLHLTGDAFDVDLYGWDRDDVPLYVWDWLHRVGKDLGMSTYLKWDRGHFEHDRLR